MVNSLLRKFSLPSLLLNPRNALAIILIIYFYFTLLTCFSSALPVGGDTPTHLFQIWLFQHEGFTSWNHWWYAGNPQLDQYPPLSHWIPSLFSGFLGVEFSFTLFRSLLFILLPISVYALLNEFELKNQTKSIALYLACFSASFINFFYWGVYSLIFALPFALLFFKYAKRFLDSNRISHAIFSSFFLALAALSHLFVPVCSAILFLIYLICFKRKLNSLIRYILVCALAGILISFFWIPFLLNYHIGGGAPSLSPIQIIFSIIKGLARAFVSYVNLFSFILLTLFGVLLLFCGYTFYSKKNFNQFFFLLFILLLLPIITLTPIGSSFQMRISIFFAIFFPLLIAQCYNLNKHIDMLVHLMILGMFLSLIFYPFFNVPHSLTTLAEWASENSEQRVLFLPEGFGMLSSNTQKPNPLDFLYDTYLLPSFGKEVYNGWFSEFKPHNENDAGIGFSCTSSKTVSEIVSGLSLFGQTQFDERSECSLPQDKLKFCSTLQEASVDTVFVNNYFPEVKDYFDSLSCMEEKAAFNEDTAPPVIAYKVLGHKPYVDYNFNYTKHSGKIEITLEGPLTDSITIRESYYPYWKAYLDEKEIPVNESPSQFLQVDLSIQEGQHTLLLVYSPPRYGNIFLYLSVSGWLLAMLLAIFVLLNSNLQKQIENTLFKK